MEIKEGEPSSAKIDEFIRSLENNIAIGEDRICEELLKLGGPGLANEIFKLISLIWHKK